MLRFSRWLQIQERKKAHYSGAEHDGKNFPQVADRYKSLRNASKKVLRTIAAKDGINPEEPNGKLTSDILRHEFGDDKVDGYYNKKTEGSVNKVKLKQKADQSAKPSYLKDKEK